MHVNTMDDRVERTPISRARAMFMRVCLSLLGGVIDDRWRRIDHGRGRINDGRRRRIDDGRGIRRPRGGCRAERCADSKTGDSTRRNGAPATARPVPPVAGSPPASTRMPPIRRRPPLCVCRADGRHCHSRCQNRNQVQLRNHLPGSSSPFSLRTTLTRKTLTIDCRGSIFPSYVCNFRRQKSCVGDDESSRLES